MHWAQGYRQSERDGAAEGSNWQLVESVMWSLYARSDAMIEIPKLQLSSGSAAIVRYPGVAEICDSFQVAKCKAGLFTRA